MWLNFNSRGREKVMKFSFFIALALCYMTPVQAGNAYTGQIVINGQIMGGASDVIKGSGVKRSINRKVGAFLSVILEGGFNVNYRHGSPSLSITGDVNIIEHVLASVTNQTLRLSIDKSYSSSYPIAIDISSQSLQEMNLAGVGEVKLDNLKTDQLTINITGTGDVSVTGKANTLKLIVQGTGDVMARYLDSDAVTVELEGTGNVEVTAHSKLDVNMTGVGNVLYFGSPQNISKQISGVGDVEPGE